MVADYLGFEAPQDDEPADQPGVPRSAPSEAPDAAVLAQMTGMGSIPASDALKNAQTAIDGLAAVERMFFGTLVEL